ncbi:MAG: MFS transporter [Alphaproteobacteria bacterium]|nr:MFS transporter [Alphaproteobacteria bacterium]
MNKSLRLNKPVLFGHVFECFDNTLYGYFAVILAPIFFPSESYTTSLIASYGAFAAGFLARPLGAILFGIYGDKMGRQKALLYSMVCVALPTFVIAITPTYESIGIFAPLTLITCRLAQGLFMGGEYTGVNLYLSENNNHKKLGSQTGILEASGIFGAVFATIFGAIVTLEPMPAWAWRIPFLFGSFSTLIIFFYRLRLSETSSFKRAKEKDALLKFPLAYLFKEHRFDLLMACIISGLAMMPFYYSTIFGNRLFHELGYSHSESMFLNMVTTICVGVIIIYSGKLADRIGFATHIFLGSFLVSVLTFPAFSLISNASSSTLQVYGFIGILSSVGVMINCSTMPYIASFFPTKCRFSGVALSVTTGQAIFGGSAPLMASWLTDTFHTRYAPAVWLALVAIVTASIIIYREIVLHNVTNRGYLKIGRIRSIS